MTKSILICGLQVSITVDESLSLNSTRSAADKILRPNPRICRNDTTAFEILAMELIDEECFEGIKDRVKKTHPAEPHDHIFNWDDVSSVYDDGQNKDSCYSMSLGCRLCCCGDGAEHHAINMLVSASRQSCPEAS